VLNKCKWSSKALDDLFKIQEFINQDNPKASVDLTKKIVSKVINQLSLFQNIGRSGRVYGTRELIIPNTSYIAVYRVKLETVEILRIIHVSMKWSDNFETTD
jgi:toxin ParE1/3/4